MLSSCISFECFFVFQFSKKGNSSCFFVSTFFLLCAPVTWMLVQVAKGNSIFGHDSAPHMPILIEFCLQKWEFCKLCTCLYMLQYFVHNFWNLPYFSCCMQVLSVVDFGTWIYLLARQYTKDSAVPGWIFFETVCFMLFWLGFPPCFLVVIFCSFQKMNKVPFLFHFFQ